MKTKKEDRSTWVIGGTSMIGVGVGLIFVHSAPLIFVACIILGVGLGLVIVPFVPKND